MLVLGRKQNERIHIGDDIIITVLEVRGQTVKIGIEAPREVRVLRGELDFFHEPAQAASHRRKNAMAVA